jgi:flavin reductase (DIM6/NTAB) family NADH-FMN oxidoreductase RutF
MPIDAEAFRAALGQFASGVTIVTTRDARGVPLGLTVSSFCSVSLAPPLVLVCIDLRSDAHAGFRDTARFGVSILAEGQEELSELFAWGGAARFEAAQLVEGVTGVPLVAGTLARLECSVVSAHDEGDHRVYVGRVEHAQVDPGRPLVYHRGEYHRLGAP